MDQFSKLVASFSALISSFAWPVVVAVFAMKILPSIKVFLEKTNEISLKAGGVEATAKIEVAAALAAASTKPGISGVAQEQNEEIFRKVTETVNSLSEANFEMRNSLVLWVDDWQDNTVYERQALSFMGVKFILSDSTEDALAKIHSSKFDLIISDMQRPGDDKAGYTLLERLPDDHAPYIIYRSSLSHEDSVEARRRGAVGITNKPEELFKMVVNVLGKMNEPNWRSAIASPKLRTARSAGFKR